MGLRLRPRQAQADAGDIVLLYADESEVLTHPYLAHAWAERGAELQVRAPGQSRKVALMGALDAGTGELVFSTSPTKVSADFIAFLRRLDWRYGPKPGSTRLPVVLVLDNGPIHTSKASRAALDARPWIVEPRGSPDTVEWLPRHAPELNDIERTWRDLKRHYLAHHTFKGAADLSCVIHAAVRQLNKERMNPHPCSNLEKAA